MLLDFNQQHMVRYVMCDVWKPIELLFVLKN